MRTARSAGSGRSPSPDCTRASSKLRMILTPLCRTTSGRGSHDRSVGHPYIRLVGRRPTKLSAPVLAFLRNPTNTKLLSVVSVWEILIKLRLGKVTISGPLRTILVQQQAHGIQILPATLDHVFAVETLPPVHKDPFDRLLIAQANVEGAVLLTPIAVFARYPVRCYGNTDNTDVATFPCDVPPAHPARQVHGRVDEADVRERLREVADESLRLRVVLLGQQAHVVAQAQKPLKDPTGVFMASQKM